MSSDSEACKPVCRGVLHKTQPKVFPKLPIRAPLKASVPIPKTQATISDKSSVDLSPKSSQKKFEPPAFSVRGRTPATPKSPPGNSNKKTLSNTATPVSVCAAIKKNKQEYHARRSVKISGYGRIQKSSKYGRIVPEGMPLAGICHPIAEKKRCGWISPQSESEYIAYHDEEWGVPVYDQIRLFELVVLVGAQAELRWAVILSKREHFRAAFSGFDPAIVSNFDEKKILCLASDCNLWQPEAKIRGAVNNAKKLLEVAGEFGSFSSYLWSFVNHRPIANKYRISTQVPVKSPKSEAISKDLHKRGFRFVGPTVVYSLMQACGMVNDHLLQCFRHEDCLKLSNKGRGGAKGEAGVILVRRDEVVVC